MDEGEQVMSCTSQALFCSLVIPKPSDELRAAPGKANWIRAGAGAGTGEELREKRMIKSRQVRNRCASSADGTGLQQCCCDHALPSCPSSRATLQPVLLPCALIMRESEGEGACWWKLG